MSKHFPVGPVGVQRGHIPLCAGRNTCGSQHRAVFCRRLGYGDIGPFGNTKIRTPALDKFAKVGMNFTSFYATPACSMSRACLMTGRYNARVSMPGVLFPQSEIGLHPNEITVAEILKQQGYATACIGKWYLGRALFADHPAGLRPLLRHPLQ